MLVESYGACAQHKGPALGLATSAGPRPALASSSLHLFRHAHALSDDGFRIQVGRGSPGVVHAHRMLQLIHQIPELAPVPMVSCAGTTGSGGGSSAGSAGGSAGAALLHCELAGNPGPVSLRHPGWLVIIVLAARHGPVRAAVLSEAGRVAGASAALLRRERTGNPGPVSLRHPGWLVIIVLAARHGPVRAAFLSEAGRVGGASAALLHRQRNIP